MPQHMDALALANEVRFKRSEIKRQIHDGEKTVQAVLADPPAEVLTMSISELLKAQHRWGDQRTRRLCQRLVISELRKVGTLTERERSRITALLVYSSGDEIEWAA